MQVFEYPARTEIVGKCSIMPEYDSYSLAMVTDHTQAALTIGVTGSGTVMLPRADALKLAMAILNKLAVLPEEVTA